MAPTDRSMPPATSTSVPAAAMMIVADCWSRMLTRFGRRRKFGLATRQQDEQSDERHEDAAAPHELLGARETADVALPTGRPASRPPHLLARARPRSSLHRVRRPVPGREGGLEDRRLGQAVAAQLGHDAAVRA